jgi:DNA-binding NarL/FixJ family response regulator
MVADDSPVFRDGMVALLESVDQVELVGQATDAEEASRAAVALNPDVVLMDLDMPGGGIEATRQIKATSPHVAVLVLTMHEDDDAVVGAMQAGARGYVLKGARRAELVRSIRTAADGGAVFSPAVAARLGELSRLAAARSQAASFPELTEREQEILGLVARGHSNSEIAERLYLSEKTVRNYVSSVLGKLQVAGRPQAIVKAREAGLGRT